MRINAGEASRPMNQVKVRPTIKLNIPTPRPGRVPPSTPTSAKDQLAYLRIWKWCLAFESLMLAGFGFSFSFPCGLSTLVIWATSNLFLYREIAKPAKTKRLIIWGLANAIVNSLAFFVSGVSPIILNRMSTNISFEKAIQSISSAWPQTFVMVLLFSIFNRALIFAIATAIQKIISTRAKK